MKIKTQLISEMHDVLKEYNFYRNGLVWNRDNCDYIDVIDLQISKSNDMFTINVGIADKSILQTCWGMDGVDVVDEASCTVRSRLGELLYGRDMWWDLSKSDAIDELLNGLHGTLIPFLQRNHSIEHMIDALENDPAARRYPPGIIYLALLYNRKGDGERCANMFESMELNTAWRKKASDILAAVGGRANKAPLK